MIELYWLNSNNIVFEKEFNLLLENKFHYHHQRMLKHLQDKLKYESSIPIIDKILKSKLQAFFEYSGSEDIVIAKWFSHALAGIGTESAINTIIYHGNSTNKSIASEMKYRLLRIRTKSEKRNEIVVIQKKESLLSRILKKLMK